MGVFKISPSKASAALVAILFSIFTLIVVSANKQGLDNKNVGPRLQIHAYPVAVSYLYHGHKHDYTAYASISNIFRSSDSVETQLKAAVNANVPYDDGVYLWAVDDRGFADFVIAAFALFGPDAHSIYVFYFCVIGLSIGLFAVYFFERPLLLGIGCVGLLSIYSVLPLLSLIGPDPRNPVITIYETRILEIPSVIPVVHLLLACFHRPKLRGRVFLPLFGRLFVLSGAAAGLRFWGCLVGQLLIFMLLYHSRSSLGWMTLSLVGSAVGIAVLRAAMSRTDRSWRSALRQTAPVIMLLGAHLVMVAYQHVAYHPRYFSDRGPRTVFHNALMGLADCELGPIYGLDGTDPSAARSVIAFMKEHEDPRLTDQWTADAVMNAFGGTDFPLDEYEHAARDMYFHIWRTHFPRMLEQHLIRRPMALFGQLRAYGPNGVTAAAKDAGLWYSPFRWPVVIFLPLLILLLLAGPRDRLPPRVALAPVVFLACSMVPSVIFYFAITQMVGFFLSVSAIILTATLLVPVTIFGRLVRR